MKKHASVSGCEMDNKNASLLLFDQLSDWVL